MARGLFGPDGEEEVKHALAALSGAIRTGTKPKPLSRQPEFLNTEMLNLRDSLVYAGNPAI
jgi:hypothetical protein